MFCRAYCRTCSVPDLYMHCVHASSISSVSRITHPREVACGWVACRSRQWEYTEAGKGSMQDTDSPCAGHLQCECHVGSILVVLLTTYSFHFPSHTVLYHIALYCITNRPNRAIHLHTNFGEMHHGLQELVLASRQFQVCTASSNAVSYRAALVVASACV